ncbi:hypothetical protein LP419_14635 [Massilia sp. H-1]|nr:hypothetical protein LP419_14635 [Massilia sp. H-1]
MAANIGRYNDFKPTAFATWHPVKQEMILVRRHNNTPQLFSIAKPGAPLTLLTDYAEPVRGARYQPRLGKYYVFNKDVGGNEVFRSYRREDAKQRRSGADHARRPARARHLAVREKRAHGVRDGAGQPPGFGRPDRLDGQPGRSAQAGERAQAGRAARRRLVRFPFLARRQAAGVHRIRVGQ